MSSNQQNAKIFKIILAGELRKATAAIRFRTVMQQHFGDEFVVGQPLDEAIAEEEQHQERMVEVEEVRPINLPEEEPMVAEPEFDDFAEIIHTADCEECNQLSGTYGCTLANKMMFRSKSLNDLDREMADSEDDDYGLKRSKSMHFKKVNKEHATVVYRPYYDWRNMMIPCQFVWTYVHRNFF
jgi:hypothetical protein